MPRTQAFDVAGIGLPSVLPGCLVVDVAPLGLAPAARVAADPVAGDDVIGQVLRRLVGVAADVDHAAHRVGDQSPPCAGRVCGQPTGQRCRHGAVTVEVAGLVVEVQQGGKGDADLHAGSPALPGGGARRVEAQQQAHERVRPPLVGGPPVVRGVRGVGGGLDAGHDCLDLVGGEFGVHRGHAVIEHPRLDPTIGQRVVVLLVGGARVDRDERPRHRLTKPAQRLPAGRRQHPLLHQGGHRVGQRAHGLGQAPRVRQPEDATLERGEGVRQSTDQLVGDAQPSVDRRRRQPQHARDLLTHVLLVHQLRITQRARRVARPGHRGQQVLLLRIGPRPQPRQILQRVYPLRRRQLRRAHRRQRHRLRAHADVHGVDAPRGV